MGGIIGVIGSDLTVEYDEALKAIEHRISNANRVVTPQKALMWGSVDAEDKAQPWRRGKLFLVADFDIFNLAEIVEELNTLRKQFNAENIGDVLLTGWEAWGSALFNRIEGDFALAIYDDRGETLVLARDRVGARPLYYTIDDHKVFFASEYKGILSMWGHSPVCELDVLQMLQSTKMVPSEATLVAGISQVPPRSFIQFENGGIGQKESYWEPRLDLQDFEFSQHCANVEHSFLNAIQKRIVPGELIVVSLSGGIDSIAIIGGIRKLYPESEIHTLTIADSDDDHEKIWAEKVARYYGTVHKTIVFKTEDIKSLLPGLIWHLEDPIARTETLMSYVLAREASKIAKTIFREDGADGLFGGMSRHGLVAKAGNFPVLRPIVDQLYGFSQSGLVPNNTLSQLAFELLLRRKIPNVPIINGAKTLYAKKHLPDRGKELQNHTLIKGAKHSLPMLIQKVERVKAAFGVRCISPFVDSEVMKVAFQIPSKCKNNGRKNKIVFREAIKGFVPSEFVNRPKHPQRLRESKVFCDVLSDLSTSLLNRKSVECRNVFSWPEVEKLLACNPMEPWSPEHAMRIWTLILTEIWFRTFIDQDKPDVIKLGDFHSTSTHFSGSTNEKRQHQSLCWQALDSV